MVEDKGRLVYENVVQHLNRDAIDHDGELRGMLEILAKCYREDVDEDEFMSMERDCTNLNVMGVNGPPPEGNEGN